MSNRFTNSERTAIELVSFFFEVAFELFILLHFIFLLHTIQMFLVVCFWGSLV